MISKSYALTVLFSLVGLTVSLATNIPGQYMNEPPPYVKQQLGPPQHPPYLAHPPPPHLSGAYPFAPHGTYATRANPYGARQPPQQHPPPHQAHSHQNHPKQKSGNNSQCWKFLSQKKNSENKHKRRRSKESESDSDSDQENSATNNCFTGILSSIGHAFKYLFSCFDE